MRVVIDLQGAQTESRFRGIGRYSLALADAIVRQAGAHEVILALNGLFPESIESIRAHFHGILPAERIRTWQVVGPTRAVGGGNAARSEVAERVREAAIAAMRPDVVLVTSVFEGWGDDAVTSLGVLDTETPVVAILYDLIPFLSPDVHLVQNPQQRAFFGRKLDNIRRASHLLAISESSKSEGISILGCDSEMITTISSGCDPRFSAVKVEKSDLEKLKADFGIVTPFLMYTGGGDDRKNLPRLIEAFSLLEERYRKECQLVIVGKIPDPIVDGLKQAGKAFGVGKESLLFTGFVDDQQLMQLYGSCEAFVFPSLHEGFGLPVLEAMACGAPVICSWATSLPEVMGWDEGMFDPLSPLAIAEKIKRVLSDSDFRADLIAHGQKRADQFTWDHSAKLALTALEANARPSWVKENEVPAYLGITVSEYNLAKKHRPRILVVKLDHMGDLLLAIPAIRALRTRYPGARIEGLVGSWNSQQAEYLGLFDHVHTLDYFRSLSSEQGGIANEDFVTRLMRLPHFDLAIDLRRQREGRFLLSQVNASVRAGYLTGDPAIDATLDIALESQPDVPGHPSSLNKRSIALQMLDLVDAIPTGFLAGDMAPSDLSIEAAGRHGVAVFPSAGNEVKEWGRDRYLDLARSLLEGGTVDRVGVFVVASDDADFFRQTLNPGINLYERLDYPDLVETLKSYALVVANNSFGAHLASFLGIPVIGLYGGHETVDEWVPVFGEVTIVQWPVTCSPCHIPHRSDCPRQLECLERIEVSQVVQIVKEKLAASSSDQSKTLNQLTDHLLSKLHPLLSEVAEDERARQAEAIAFNLQPKRKRRLYVDVSELILQDSRTGIQRVVRSILEGFRQQSEQNNLEIFPCYANEQEWGYRVAHHYMQKKMSPGHAIEASDEWLVPAPGDIFLGLDLRPSLVPRQKSYYRHLRMLGVRVYFVVYDLLPVQLPEYFDDALPPMFDDWLEVVSESDGARCISGATQNALKEWMTSRDIPLRKDFSFATFSLGAQIEDSIPTRGLPDHVATTLKALENGTTFIMVGTMEPRKGHLQVLEAFDLLWRTKKHNLVIVGKRGWKVHDLIERIESHPELGKHLFWFEGASDEWLERLYQESDCLIAASYGEGFGLPLIEAARYQLPIIARDIPVFREVAGDTGAYFFKAESAEDLAKALKGWISLKKRNVVPGSDSISMATWDDSARQLLNSLI